MFLQPKLWGHADDVAVVKRQLDPAKPATPLCIEFTAEDEHTGGVVPIQDLLLYLREHHPEALAQAGLIQGKVPTPRVQGRVKRKPLQCKHVPDQPILAYLAKQTDTVTNLELASAGEAMPADTPRKLRLAKLEMLMRRGLIDGCTCGCAGHFYITSRGRLHLAALRRGQDKQPG